MLMTVKTLLKETLIIIAMMQVVIYLIKMIVPRSLKKALKALMKGFCKTIELIFSLIGWLSVKGYNTSSKYLKEHKTKQPAMGQQTDYNVIPFPSIKKEAK